MRLTLRRKRVIPEPMPPAWVQALFDEHGVSHMFMGRLFEGSPIWACCGCSCWFSVDDDLFLDRYSFVNADGGWCTTQHLDDCSCHSLPRRRPTDRLDQDPDDDCYDLSGKPLPYGRCDTCGAPCDSDGCTADRGHQVALTGFETQGARRGR